MAYYGIRRFRRKSSSGGGDGGSTKGAVIAVAMLCISVLVALIMIGIVAGQFSTLLDDNTIPWDNFTGAESMAGMFPLLMLLMEIVIGGLLSYLTFTGKARPISILGVMVSSVAAVLFAIFLPIMMDFCEDLLVYTNFSGFVSIVGMIPMLLILAVMGALGFFSYKLART